VWGGRGFGVEPAPAPAAGAGDSPAGSDQGASAAFWFAGSLAGGKGGGSATQPGAAEHASRISSRTGFTGSSSSKAEYRHIPARPGAMAHEIVPSRGQRRSFSFPVAV
jgi:hypothetical protein